MILSEIIPVGELSIFTESFWSCQLSAGQKYHLFSDGTLNVIYADQTFQVNNKNYSKGWYIAPFKGTSIFAKSTITIYGIRLKAFSVFNLIQTLQLPFEQLLEFHVIENNVALNESSNQLNQANSVHSALPVLENINFELLHKSFSVNVNLREKVNFILDRKGKVRIDEMCKHFEVSRQGLHKSFKQGIGISPKDLCVIWQLNHYFALTQQENNLTQSAIDGGYYDQSHSIKAFKSYNQMTPKQFIQDHEKQIAFLKSTIDKRFGNGYDPR